MAIVAEQYAFVIGVDTHAATHSLALVSAATGGVVDQAVFPNSPAGCDRAVGWISRGVAGQSALVVIEGVGPYPGFFAECWHSWVLICESACPATDNWTSLRFNRPAERHLAGEGRNRAR